VRMLPTKMLGGRPPSSSPVALAVQRSASNAHVSPKMSAVESSSASVVERVQNFVSDHRKVILVGAAVAVAAGGVAYYASSSSTPKRKKPKVKKSRKAQDKPTEDVESGLSPSAQVEPHLSQEEAFTGLFAFP